MNAYVNTSCIGCQMCTGTCPSIFMINDSGQAQVFGTITAENEVSVQDAIEGCPMGAIEKQ